MLHYSEMFVVIARSTMLDINVLRNDKFTTLTRHVQKRER